MTLRENCLRWLALLCLLMILATIPSKQKWRCHFLYRHEGGSQNKFFLFLPLAAGHARSFNKNPKNIAKSQSWKNELMSVSRPPKKGEQDNNMFVWTHLRFGSCQHTASTRPAQREKGHQDRSRQLNNRKKAGILFSCVSTLWLRGQDLTGHAYISGGFGYIYRQLWVNVELYRQLNGRQPQQLFPQKRTEQT